MPAMMPQYAMPMMIPMAAQMPNVVMAPPMTGSPIYTYNGAGMA
jgi:hypothetical protein